MRTSINNRRIYHPPVLYLVHSGSTHFSSAAVPPLPTVRLGSAAAAERRDDPTVPNGPGGSCGRGCDHGNLGRHLPADRPDFVDLLAEVLWALGAVSGVRCCVNRRGLTRRTKTQVTGPATFIGGGLIAYLASSRNRRAAEGFELLATRRPRRKDRTPFDRLGPSSPVGAMFPSGLSARRPRDDEFSHLSIGGLAGGDGQW